MQTPAPDTAVSKRLKTELDAAKRREALALEASKRLTAVSGDVDSAEGRRRQPRRHGMVAVRAPARRRQLDEQRVGAREQTLDSVSAFCDARVSRAMGASAPVAKVLGA